MAITPEKAIENLRKLVEDFDFKVAQIILAHPESLLVLDMEQFPTNCYFISQPLVKKDEFLMVEDETWRKSLYEFARDKPDKVLRGKNAEKFHKAFDKIMKKRGVDIG